MDQETQVETVEIEETPELDEAVAVVAETRDMARLVEGSLSLLSASLRTELTDSAQHHLAGLRVEMERLQRLFQFVECNVDRALHVQGPDFDGLFTVAQSGGDQASATAQEGN